MRAVVVQQEARHLRVEKEKEKGRAILSVGRSGYGHEELARQGGNKLAKISGVLESNTFISGGNCGHGQKASK